MLAVIVDPSAPGSLALGMTTDPRPADHEAVVNVEFFSLNRGEVRAAPAKMKGSRIGWDIVGRVVQAAEDGRGPGVGNRVIGYCARGDGWAERVAVPTDALAVVPDGVTPEEAVTLPVAGLTALHAVEQGNRILGRRVLITGCTGGVGLFAVQLASLAGAEVVAPIRRPFHEEFVRGLGVVSHLPQFDRWDDPEGLERLGPYPLIVDGVGGPVLSRLLPMLDRDGVVVSYGATDPDPSDLRPLDMILPGRSSLYGLQLDEELALEPASVGMTRLLRLMHAERLACPIGLSKEWTDIGEAAQALLNRDFYGKAVIRIPSAEPDAE